VLQVHEPQVNLGAAVEISTEDYARRFAGRCFHGHWPASEQKLREADFLGFGRRVRSELPTIRTLSAQTKQKAFFN